MTPPQARSLEWAAGSIRAAVRRHGEAGVHYETLTNDLASQGFPHAAFATLVDVLVRVGWLKRRGMMLFLGGKG